MGKTHPLYRKTPPVPQRLCIGGKTKSNQIACEIPARPRKSDIWIGEKPKPPSGMLVNQKTGRTAVLARPWSETKHQRKRVNATPGCCNNCQVDMGGSAGFPLLSFADSRVCKIAMLADTLKNYERSCELTSLR